MEIDTLKSELAAVNINPIDVKIITPKYPVQDYVPYILFFKKAETTLKELRNVKALFHTIVSWEPFRNRQPGFTQCTRCQRPGHGFRHCNMPFRCMYCSGDHESSCCPHYNEINNKLKESEVNPNVTIPCKCCNCGSEGHFANDPACPNKIKYTESRKRLASNGRTKQQRFVSNVNAFPSLPDDGMISSSRNPMSYAGAVTNTPSIPFQNFINLIPNSSYRTDAFFSHEEIISLTSILNHFQNLQSISREHVILTVIQISLKYLFNHG